MAVRVLNATCLKLNTFHYQQALIKPSVGPVPTLSRHRQPLPTDPAPYDVRGPLIVQNIRPEASNIFITGKNQSANHTDINPIIRKHKCVPGLKETRTMTATDLLAQLVEFDSSNEVGNLALIGYIADYLQSCGIECEIVSDPVLKQKNLLARLGGQGTSNGIVLVGHSDVVSAAEIGWTSDPFSLTDSGGDLVARGVCDMKGFLATVLAQAPDIAARDLSAPVHLGITFNGESDFLGAKRLARQIHDQHITPRAVILGKPSGMQISTQHKGLTRVITEVHTLGGHTATENRSPSAVWIAANLIEYLHRLEDEARRMPDPQFRCDSNWTTVNVGSVFGGSTSNTVASRCTFEWEISDVSTFSANELLKQFTRYCEATMHELATSESEPWIESAQEYSSSPIDAIDQHPAFDTIAKANECEGTIASSNHTEAAVYHQADLPVLVCGPGYVADSHKANESLPKQQLAACDRFIGNLISQLDAFKPDETDNIAA